MPSPTTIADLYRFYHDTVKPLYAEVQLTNTLPVEVLFEINAAFDHLSRITIYNESEAQVVGKAYSHLKRSCLDIFKLKVKQTLDGYEKLQEVELGLIDNGAFQRVLIRLMGEIRSGALEARRHEGDSRRDDAMAVAAFERWAPVYERCALVEKDFLESPKIDWAKRTVSEREQKAEDEREAKRIKDMRRERIFGIFLGVIPSLIASLIFFLALAFCMATWPFEKHSRSSPESLPTTVIDSAHLKPVLNATSQTVSNSTQPSDSLKALKGNAPVLPGR